MHLDEAYHAPQIEHKFQFVFFYCTFVVADDDDDDNENEYGGMGSMEMPFLLFMCNVSLFVAIHFFFCQWFELF